VSVRRRFDGVVRVRDCCTRRPKQVLVYSRYSRRQGWPTIVICTRTPGTCPAAICTVQCSRSCIAAYEQIRTCHLQTTYKELHEMLLVDDDEEQQFVTALDMLRSSPNIERYVQCVCDAKGVCMCVWPPASAQRCRHCRYDCLSVQRGKDNAISCKQI
jgi:hypothetical protein